MSTIGAIALFVAASLPAGAHHGADAVITASQAAPAAASAETASGTINEIVVDNRVTGTTTRYTLLRRDDGVVLVLHGANSEALFEGTRVVTTGRRAGDTLQVESYSVIAGPPQRMAAQAANTGQVQGTLLLAHADDFEHDRSEFKLVVRGDDGYATELELGVIPDVLRTGMTVVAYGTGSADHLSLDTHRIEVLALPASTKARAESVGIQSVKTNKVLVLLVKFTDNVEPFRPAAVQQVMVTNSNSVAKYYSEASLGLQALSVTVSGLANDTWLQSGLPKPTVCDYSAISAAADAAYAKAYPGDTTVYDNRFYVFPGLSACGWAGLAYVGWGVAYSNGVNSLGVYGHELGHNFGLLHAASLRCTGQVVEGTCSASEYGDPFDIMGNNNSGGTHFNAAQKSILNWIPASSVKTHGSGTANYTLSPIESPGGTSYAVKIPAAANRTYWVEYRQPIGFDSVLSAFPNNGAQIRVASPFAAICSGCADDTELLDMTPATGSFNDGALVAGQSYTDSTYGITITVGSASPTALNVTVAAGSGSPTTTTLASSVNPSAFGASVKFTASVTGTAPTGTVSFTDGGTSIAGCGAVTLSGSGNTRTAQCTTSALAAGTHGIAAVYGGGPGNKASASPALSQTVNKATSTTALASSKNPSAAGTSVTFTATVVGSNPTGSVNFKDGASSITGCSAVALTGSGNGKTAACSTSALSAATHSISAAYGGDVGNTASNSATLSQVVNAAGPGPSTTTLASSQNPSTFGTSVTFTATVVGSNPTGSVNFKDGASSIAGCSAVALAGSGNSRTAACATSILSAGTHSISAAYGGDAGNAASNSTTLSQVVNASGGSINVALASNGGVASASSTYNAGFPAAAVNDNVRSGVNWANGGGWNDSTANSYPDWVQIAFNGNKTIDHVVVYTLQDNYANPVEPTDTMTFSQYGTTAFTVQGWNGSAWVTLGSVSGNNLVKRTVNFASYTTSSIRINVTSALASFSRITEVEAWGSAASGPGSSTTTLASSQNPSTFGTGVTFTATVAGSNPTGSVNFKDGASSIAGCSAVALAGSGNSRTAACTTSALSAGTHSITGAYGGDAANTASTSATLSQAVNAGGGPTNVALASNGGVANASSTYSAGYAAAAVNDNVRSGVNWANGGGWNDNTANRYPDWVQISFNGNKTIDHVVVYTVQDNYANPAEPTDTMTFSLYGVTAFTVQGWTGSKWTTLGSVGGNKLVKRTVSFAGYTTSRIRINVTGALGGYSRITEVEAWGN